jgi:hypothetical protein
MCSCARIGEPAATRPINGSPWVVVRRDQPQAARCAGTHSSAPLFTSALTCCSAAFGELKPSACAISARVGGRPSAATHIADELQDFLLPLGQAPVGWCRFIHMDVYTQLGVERKLPREPARDRTIAATQVRRAPTRLFMPLHICASIVCLRVRSGAAAPDAGCRSTSRCEGRGSALIEVSDVWLIDNDAPVGRSHDHFGPGFAPVSRARWKRRSGQGNIGYGRGHNLVLNECSADLYLVSTGCTARPARAARGIEYLIETEPCGLVAPYAAGRRPPQFLCKRYPDVLTLFLRASLPRLARRLFRANGAL